MRFAVFALRMYQEHLQGCCHSYQCHWSTGYQNNQSTVRWTRVHTHLHRTVRYRLIAISTGSLAGRIGTIEACPPLQICPLARPKNLAHGLPGIHQWFHPGGPCYLSINRLISGQGRAFSVQLVLAISKSFSWRKSV